MNSINGLFFAGGSTELIEKKVENKVKASEVNKNESESDKETKGELPDKPLDPNSDYVIF